LVGTDVIPGTVVALGNVDVCTGFIVVLVVGTSTINGDEETLGVANIG
jgi:hypothetical protein